MYFLSFLFGLKYSLTNSFYLDLFVSSIMELRFKAKIYLYSFFTMYTLHYYSLVDNSRKYNSIFKISSSTLYLGSVVPVHVPGR